jgi:hypothetical protein
VKSYRRPKKTGLAERLAELRFAKNYHWDLDMLRGKLLMPEARRGNKYRLLNPRPLLFQLRPKINVLRVPYWKRFGNAIQQLRNAFRVAEALGAETVQFVQQHPFFEGGQAGDFELIWGDNPSLLPTLEGEFFNVSTFRLRTSEPDMARVFTEFVRPLLVAHLREPDLRVRRDDLVLHFRAGDIFRQTRPPSPKYGQPPLSYYLAAVEREQPARVWLVFEDRGNPCVDAAEAALRERGVEVLLQSGTLEEDLRLLLSASRLAAGRGSFAHMVAHLSERLHKAYFFETGDMGVLRELGVEVIIGKDADGEFRTKLLNNNWARSAEQQALMISYPADKLGFESVAISL